MKTDSDKPEAVAEAEREATLAAPSCYAPPDAPKWAIETMQMINTMTPDIKGKAFEPDWFLLRQRLEEAGRRLDVWELLREYMTADAGSERVKAAWDNLEEWWKRNGA